MTMNELTAKVTELRELKRMSDELAALIEAAQDEIKATMTAQATDTLTGDTWKITWKPVTTNRLDTTALKKALPDVAAQFTKPSTSRRFVLA